MKDPPGPPDDPEFFARLRMALDQLAVGDGITDVPLDPPVRPSTRENLLLPPAQSSLIRSDQLESVFVPDDPPSSPGVELPRGAAILIVFLLLMLGALAAAGVFHDRVSQVIMEWSQQGR